MSVQYKKLIFDDYPLTFSPIYIKKHTVLYRYSSTSDPKNTFKPRFFSDLKTAEIYDNVFGKKEKDIWFCDMKTIKLIDIRMLKYLIMDELQDLPESILNNHVIIDGVKYIFSDLLHVFTICYGLVPIKKQLDYGYYLSNFNEPFNAYGYRKGITDKDDMAVALMKRFIYPNFDGYIAPQLLALNTGDRPINLLQEICLFSPKDSLNKTYSMKKNYPKSSVDININEIIKTDVKYKNYTTKVEMNLNLVNNQNYVGGDKYTRNNYININSIKNNNIIDNNKNINIIDNNNKNNNIIDNNDNYFSIDDIINKFIKNDSNKIEIILDAFSNEINYIKKRLINNNAIYDL